MHSSSVSHGTQSLVVVFLLWHRRLPVAAPFDKAAAKAELKAAIRDAQGDGAKVQAALDLVAEREELRGSSDDIITEFRSRFGPDAIRLSEDEEPTQICYPVLRYPEKIKARNFDKEKVVKGTLEGIKGQYLILDQGVLNIRKFAGYEVSFNVV